MADETSTTLAIVPPVGPNQYNPTAGEAFPAGTPVAQSVSEDFPRTVAKAKADSDDSASVTGVAAFPGVADSHVHVQFAGPMTLTTAQWDAVTGGSGGLEVGATYYLSAATAGRITVTKPSAPNFATQVGIATSPTTLMVQIGARVEQSS